MSNTEETYYFYSRLLEEYTIDMELREYYRITYSPFPALPTVPTIPIPPLPPNDRCPTCGIDLSANMCYTCINPRCPTGMGPVMCKA
jgi:hypothetical protein